jgi:hypothetical protein
MLSRQAQGATTVKLLSPVSAANTAAATSAWVDIRPAEGDLVFIVEAGAVTGGIVWTIEHASDGSGTGAAAITPSDGAFAAVTANTVQKRCLGSDIPAGWVRCVGTITTGPVLVAASVTYHPKYV